MGPNENSYWYLYHNNKKKKHFYLTRESGRYAQIKQSRVMVGKLNLTDYSSIALHLRFHICGLGPD